MATSPQDVTERIFYDYKNLQEILGVGINEARNRVEELNAELKAKHYLVVPHKVPAPYFWLRYGFEVKK